MDMLYRFFLDYEHFRTLSVIFSYGSAIIVAIVTFLPYICRTVTNYRKKIKRGIKKEQLIALLGLGFVIISIIVSTNGVLTPQVVPDYKKYIYFGHIENGRPNGYGRVYDLDRNICYVGHLKDGEQNGKGKIYTTKKIGAKQVTYLSYDGDFKNGKKTGYGVQYIYTNGVCKVWYEGEFLEDEFNGYGILDGYGVDSGNLVSHYEGAFAYGKKFGYGRYETYDDDGNYLSRYRGTFSYGMKSGLGIFEFLTTKGENVIFCGYLSADQIYGEGVMYSEDGSVICQGQFENGKLTEEKDVENKYPFPKDTLWQ